jgi:hypothetical protein
VSVTSTFKAKQSVVVYVQAKAKSLSRKHRARKRI